MNCIFCQSKMFCEDEGFFVCNNCPIETAHYFNQNDELVAYAFAIKKDDVDTFIMDISIENKSLTITRWRQVKTTMADTVKDTKYPPINIDFQISPQKANVLLDRFLKQKVFS